MSVKEDEVDEKQRKSRIKSSEKIFENSFVCLEIQRIIQKKTKKEKIHKT